MHLLIILTILGGFKDELDALSRLKMQELAVCVQLLRCNGLGFQRPDPKDYIRSSSTQAFSELFDLKRSRAR